MEAIEAEEFVGSVARLHEAVRVERESVARVEAHGGLRKAGLGGEAEWQGWRQLELSAVEKGHQVPGIGQHADSARRNAKRQAGGEAVLQSSEQTPVEPNENLGGLGCCFGQAADGTQDERHRHGGFQALAAHVANDGKGLAVSVTTIIMRFWRSPKRSMSGCVRTPAHALKGRPNWNNSEEE